ncbi:hypothetical protein [Paludisphaera mucosa]|uniref:Uncharacterized protein n=1 Tax=Paludisphaera mucosa TaxID=3030827 RepID=A0ABT6FJU4_9BACT|nr:hypothetical protein [Paludisphaera mucosa]MDG3007819.1 hypothetical protein [Paludisphaera mucosa]
MTTLVRLRTVTEGRGGGRASARRRRRVLTLERLEAREVLNASIAIDADGGLTYRTEEDGAHDRVRISVAGDVYTFASDQVIELVENAAGLEVDDGTFTVSVKGISRLAIDARDSTGRVLLASTNVPTSIHALLAMTDVQLGDGASPEGLTALTAPITYTSDTDIGRIGLVDSGSTRAADYVVASDSIAATGGFGGLTFSRVFMLTVEGASTEAGGTSNYYVPYVPGMSTVDVHSHGQAGSRSVFTVDPETSSDTGGVGLIGSKGTDEILVGRTPSRMLIASGGGHSTVTLSDHGSTAGIRHPILFRELGGGTMDLVVDDSAGDVPRDATFRVATNGLWADSLALEGFGGEGAVLFFWIGAGIDYRAPRGLDNSLTVGGERGGLATNSLVYDGGSYEGSGSSSRLTLVGAPSSTLIYDREVHATAGPDAGEMTYEYTPTWTQLPTVVQRVAYRGVAGGGVVDLIPAVDYVLAYRGGPDPGVAISAGASPGTLTIASRSTPPAFAATTVANKTNVTVDTNGTQDDHATLVDYAAGDPVLGLASLTIVTSPNDAVATTATPPGAAFAVETTADPRPVVVAPPPESTTVEPPPAEPVAVEPAPPASPPAVPAPIVETPPAAPVVVEPTAPAPAADSPAPAQNVGLGLATRFGTRLRTSDAGRASTPGDSPALRFRTARLAQLAALRLRRAERISAARAWLHHA